MRCGKRNHHFESFDFHVYFKKKLCLENYYLYHLFLKLPYSSSDDANTHMSFHEPQILHFYIVSDCSGISIKGRTCKHRCLFFWMSSGLGACSYIGETRLHWHSNLYRWCTITHERDDDYLGYRLSSYFRNHACVPPYVILHI